MATSPKKPATKPAAPKTAHKPAAKRASAAKASAKKAGSRWATAGIVAGVGAVATVALLALRGSTPARPDAALNPGEKAHQADGADSSASFEAGIADEGTIPG